MLYTIYRITNLVNKKIYIGAHITSNINDNYMGSGGLIKKDIRLLGKDSFKKEILFIFENKEEMLSKEKELVNKEFCHRIDTYNQIVGGGCASFSKEGKVTVKDKAGNYSVVYKDDPRYLSGELVHHTKGTIQVKDKNGKEFRVPLNDERYLNGELVNRNTGKVVVKNKDGKNIMVNVDDERIKNGELIGVNLGKKHPNHYWTKGNKHKEESKIKIGLANSLKQKGNKNSQYGTCWIKKDNDVKKIKKELLEQYKLLGWEKGRGKLNRN